jgi:hypothetical protein
MTTMRLVAICLPAISCAALTACGGLSDTQEPYWANFEYRVVDDSIVPVGSATRLPMLDGYSAIIGYDSRYVYIQRTDQGDVGYDLDTHEQFPLLGNIEWSDSGYFFFAPHWRNGRWEIQVTHFGSDLAASGECLGYSDDRIVLRSAGQATIYDYDLRVVEPSDTTEEIACTVYPPTGPANR